jgi:hypothetical protein
MIIIAHKNGAMCQAGRKRLTIYGLMLLLSCLLKIHPCINRNEYPLRNVLMFRIFAALVLLSYKTKVVKILGCIENISWVAYEILL